MITNKDEFLKKFYDCVRSDIVCACDDLFKCVDRFDLKDEDKPYLEVARHYVLRPDIFRNVVFLVLFLVRMIDNYPQTHVLLDFNPKLSPAFLANLLTFNFVLNECN